MKITITELIWNSLSLAAGMEKQIPYNRRQENHGDRIHSWRMPLGCAAFF